MRALGRIGLGESCAEEGRRLSIIVITVSMVLAVPFVRCIDLAVDRSVVEDLSGKRRTNKKEKREGEKERNERNIARGKRKRRLTRYGFSPSRKLHFIAADTRTQGLVASTQGHDSQQGQQQARRRADVPPAEDDAEILGVPREEHLKKESVGDRQSQAHCQSLFSVFPMSCICFRRGLPTFMVHMSIGMSMLPASAWWCEWSMMGGRQKSA